LTGRKKGLFASVSAGRIILTFTAGISFVGDLLAIMPATAVGAPPPGIVNGRTYVLAAVRSATTLRIQVLTLPLHIPGLLIKLGFSSTFSTLVATSPGNRSRNTLITLPTT
jgi:hypothetical protein